MEFVLYLFMALTVIVLLFGLAVFVLGGELNKKYANKMMRARIFFQAIAIAVALLVIVLATKGG